MNLYLVQHGESKPKSEDPERPLTEDGAATVRRMADWSRNAGLSVAQIRHSGKARAAQTAELFAGQLDPSDGVQAVPGIAPNDDVRLVAEALDREERSIMLVGHLPFLDRLASRLITGNAEQGVVQFRNAGVVCLARNDGRWWVSWIVPPELVA